MITSTELKKQGGKWLAAARTWIQGNFLNGTTVTWNSMDFLNPRVTVKDIEDLAAIVAATAINEMMASFEKEEVRNRRDYIEFMKEQRKRLFECIGN